MAALLAGAGADQAGAFAFASGELTAAGEWAATAEFSEQRAELTCALPKRDLTQRSPSCTFQVPDEGPHSLGQRFRCGEC
jgi:hypothetical protein